MREGLLQGYTGYKRLVSSSVRARRRTGARPRVAKVPVSPIHAAHPGSSTALCGAALADVDDERPWPVNIGVPCGRCARLANKA